MPTSAHSIKAVALETGLSPHVIRSWEKRYGAVRPHRTDTNRRLYSAKDIERLTLLRNATRVGHSISAVAELPTEALRVLLSRANANEPVVAPSDKSRGTANQYLDDCIDAVEVLNAQKVEEVLGHAAV